MKPQTTVRIVAMCVALAACASAGQVDDSGLLPFGEQVERPDGQPLYLLEGDGVQVELYDLGDCALIIEEVPEYGFLVDEFCPAVRPDPRSSLFTTPNCPQSDFGDECRDWLPQFTVGRTLDEAAFVCVAKGRVEVRDGWWMTAADGVGSEAFPLTAAGTRLDSVSNEFDDRMRAACDATDPSTAEALVEILPGSHRLPITVELDVGISGSFILHAGFEPYVFPSQLPIGGAPMQVVVFEGDDGAHVGEIPVTASPTCDEPVFVIDLEGPSGQWSCRESDA